MKKLKLKEHMENFLIFANGSSLSISYNGNFHHVGLYR